MAELLMLHMQNKSITQFSNLYLPVPHVKEEWVYLKIDDANLKDTEYISNFVRFFLRKSENENIENIKQKLGKKYNALFACFAAYILDEKEFVEFFDKYDLNINATDKNTKLTPLMTAMIKYDVLKVILSKYKNIINVNCKTSENITPLHLLCKKLQIDREGEKMFLDFNDLDKNAKIKYNTPLHFAVINANLQLVSFLLNDKDVDIHAQNNIGQTPFHLIFRCSKCLEMLKLFYNYSSKSFNLLKKDIFVFIYFFFFSHILGKNSYRIASIF